MNSLRRVYRRVDDWALSLSRVEYALLIGLVSAFGVLAIGVVLGEPNYAFATGISITLTALHYLFDPNNPEE